MKVIYRGLLGMTGIGVLALAAYCAHLLIERFTHTSYLFVALFLLLILGSNILAKIVSLYMKV